MHAKQNGCMTSKERFGEEGNSMDTNGDWYQRYQTQYPQYPQQQRRKGVRVSTLIICLIFTAAACLALGAGFTKYYVDRQLSAAQDTLSQQALLSSPPSAQLQSAAAVTEQGVQGGFAPTYSKAQIIELCAPAVVGIDVTYEVSGYYGWGYSAGTQMLESSGSGIILTSDGYIVTCNHVVENASKIQVVLNDDTPYDATVVGTDRHNDLAVIKIDAVGLTPATLGDSDMLTVGDDTIAIGNPLGELRGTATSGIVSAMGRRVTIDSTNMTLIQTDAAISPGNSGGGLFNASGSLIGIVNAKASSDNAEGLGFAIPVNSVKQTIADLIDVGYVRGRAYLGVVTQNVTLQSANNGWGAGSFFGSFYGLGGTACVQVSRLIEGGAAEAAGIQVGDLILQVDDTAITSNDVLSSVIAAYNAGDRATIKIQRDEQELTVEVTFGENIPE